MTAEYQSSRKIRAVWYMLSAPKMAASIDGFFKKIEKAQTNSYNYISGNTESCYSHSCEAVFEVSPGNPLHHTLVIDLRFPDGPKIVKNADLLTTTLYLVKLRDK